MSLDIVRRAQSLAGEYHAGQLYGSDKSEPMMSHVIAVLHFGMHLGYTQPEMQASFLLHDIVEDTEMTLEELRKEGFPKFTVDAVDAVTWTEDRPALDGEKARKAMGHIGGRVVKAVDSSRNLKKTLEFLEKSEADDPFEREKAFRRLGRYSTNMVILFPGLPSPQDIEFAIIRAAA